MNTRILYAALGLTLAASAAFAQPTPALHAREARQAGRIAEGVATGELTPREAHALRGEERAIRAEERAMRSDGVVTPRERAKLNHDLNVASRDIAREKHDGERR